MEDSVANVDIVRAAPMLPRRRILGGLNLSANGVRCSWRFETVRWLCNLLRYCKRTLEEKRTN
jgi:hypothetical protein